MRSMLIYCAFRNCLKLYFYDLFLLFLSSGVVIFGLNQFRDTLSRRVGSKFFSIGIYQDRQIESCPPYGAD